MEYCYSGRESLWYGSWNRHVCRKGKFTADRHSRLTGVNPSRKQRCIIKYSLLKFSWRAHLYAPFAVIGYIDLFWRYIVVIFCISVKINSKMFICSSELFSYIQNDFVLFVVFIFYKHFTCSLSNPHHNIADRKITPGPIPNKFFESCLLCLVRSTTTCAWLRDNIWRHSKLCNLIGRDLITPQISNTVDPWKIWLVQIVCTFNCISYIIAIKFHKTVSWNLKLDNNL